MAPMQARKDRYLGRSVERSHPADTYIHKRKRDRHVSHKAGQSFSSFQKIGKDCCKQETPKERKRKKGKEKASTGIDEAK